VGKSAIVLASKRCKMSRSWRLIGLLLALCLLSGAAAAASLFEDYLRAQENDPVFATARVENDAVRLQARLAGYAYFPEGRVSASQLDIDASTRTTLSFNQPLLSYDRWLTLKEVDPRLALAAARLEQGQYELAQRLFKTVASLAEARERLSLNRSSIAALEVQLQASEQAFRLGIGTVTDVRDTEARIAQARAQTFALEAQLSAARRQYEAMIGTGSREGVYSLAPGIPTLALPPLPELLARAQDRNPAIRGGAVSVALAAIGIDRARASLFPSVNLVAQRSEIRGSTVSSSGIALRMDVPLQAGTFLRAESAGLELRKAEEQLRAQRQNVGLEAERLYGLAIAAQAELSARRNAVRAAELSLEASEQSFKGGIRTRVDVLNATQAVFQARADYSSALLRLGESLVGLRLVAAEDLSDTLVQVERIVFGR
jgi:outer membrane protein TolC